MRLVVLAVGTGALCACGAPPPPITQELLAGQYAFVSKDLGRPATDYDRSRLVLQSDGSYDLVEGGTTKQLSEKKGAWTIEPGVQPGESNVVLDHAGYPIAIGEHEIRLLIDLDAGEWWVKGR